MDERRDEIDTWLNERVTPLLPHPGAFERIRKRARRRKLGQAAIAAGGAAVIVAAAVLVPHLVLPQFRPSTAVTGGASYSATPTPRHSRSPRPQPSPSATPGSIPQGPPPVPGNFAVSSVTFVSATVGWVIGQAGVPGQCANPDPYICTSFAATDDGGATWHGGAAPDTGSPDGARGVSQIRALDGTNGWAFGPQLYATHDGGRHWARVATHGMRVTGLETVNGRAFAIWARCTGGGPDFAANCTSFSLYSTAATADQWAPVPGATGLTNGTTPPAPSSAQLVLTGSAGYLLAPGGRIYSGPVTGTAPWGPAAVAGAGAGCGQQGLGQPGPAQADGVPSDTLLAAAGTGLVELCQNLTAATPDVKQLVYSADGGRTWMGAGTVPGPGLATSLSVTPTGRVVVATGHGVDVSADAAGAHQGSLRWRAVAGASLPGGFSYVGMTTSAQGVAIPADQSVHAVWFTYDGGRRWQPSQVR